MENDTLAMVSEIESLKVRVAMLEKLNDNRGSFLKPARQADQTAAPIDERLVSMVKQHWRLSHRLLQYRSLAMKFLHEVDGNTLTLMLNDLVERQQLMGFINRNGSRLFITMEDYEQEVASGLVSMAWLKEQGVLKPVLR